MIQTVIKRQQSIKVGKSLDVTMYFQQKFI